MIKDPARMYWWELPQEEDLTKSTVHQQLFDTVRAVEERQYAIHELNLFNAKLYSNRTLMGLDWASETERFSNYAPASYTAENIVASVVDTVTALISKNWSKPTPVTKDADFETEVCAQQADRYLYAEMKRMNAWQRLQRMFNDACWGQIGAVRVDIDHDEGSLYMERVGPDELIVDQRECVSECAPTQMSHRRIMNANALKEMFPDRIREIDEAQKSNTAWTSHRAPAGNNIVVLETWKLPYMDCDGERVPGRHCIVIKEATLLDEDYDRQRFPFLIFRWADLPSGFYGQSLVEQITPFQLRMNELNRVIQRSQDLMSVPRIFVEGSSKVSREQIDNEVGRVLFYRGKPPVVMNWPAQSAEIYAERERIRGAAFEYAGISQLSAQAKLPQNVRLDSSKALREFSLRENERFSIQAQRYEQMIIELAEHILELSAELYKDDDNKVTFVDRTLVEDINWSTVAEFFKKRRFVFQLEASSIANMTPAAREDIINSWANQGLIDLATYKQLLNHPDLEEQMDINAAGIDDIKWTMSKLDRGEFRTPEPEQDLQSGIALMQKTLLRRLRQDAPEDVIQNYRDWITLAQAAIDQATAMETARKAQLQAQAEQQLMAEQGGQPQIPGSPDAFAAGNVGPEGNIMPGVASTTQGVPADRAGVGLGGPVPL